MNQVVGVLTFNSEVVVCILYFELWSISALMYFYDVIQYVFCILLYQGLVNVGWKCV